MNIKREFLYSDQDKLIPIQLTKLNYGVAARDTSLAIDPERVFTAIEIRVPVDTSAIGYLIDVTQNIITEIVSTGPRANTPSMRFEKIERGKTYNIYIVSKDYEDGYLAADNSLSKTNPRTIDFNSPDIFDLSNTMVDASEDSQWYNYDGTYTGPLVWETPYPQPPDWSSNFEEVLEAISGAHAETVSSITTAIQVGTEKRLSDQIAAARSDILMAIGDIECNGGNIDIVIGGDEPTDEPPVQTNITSIIISPSTQETVDGISVRLTAVASGRLPDSNKLNYVWDFGDGTTPQDTGSIAFVDHIFTTPQSYPKNYTVTVKVTNLDDNAETTPDVENDTAIVTIKDPTVPEDFPIYGVYMDFQNQGGNIGNVYTHTGSTRVELEGEQLGNVETQRWVVENVTKSWTKEIGTQNSVFLDIFQLFFNDPQIGFDRAPGTCIIHCYANSKDGIVTRDIQAPIVILAAPISNEDYYAQFTVTPSNIIQGDTTVLKDVSTYPQEWVIERYWNWLNKDPGEGDETPIHIWDLMPEGNTGPGSGFKKVVGDTFVLDPSDPEYFGDGNKDDASVFNVELYIKLDIPETIEGGGIRFARIKKYNAITVQAELDDPPNGALPTTATIDFVTYPEGSVLYPGTEFTLFDITPQQHRVSSMYWTFLVRNFEIITGNRDTSGITLRVKDTAVPGPTNIGLGVTFDDGTHVNTIASPAYIISDIASDTVPQIVFDNLKDYATLFARATWGNVRFSRPGSPPITENELVISRTKPFDPPIHELPAPYNTATVEVLNQNRGFAGFFGSSNYAAAGFVQTEMLPIYINKTPFNLNDYSPYIDYSQTRVSNSIIVFIHKDHVPGTKPIFRVVRRETNLLTGEAGITDVELMIADNANDLVDIGLGYSQASENLQTSDNSPIGYAYPLTRDLTVIQGGVQAVTKKQQDPLIKGDAHQNLGQNAIMQNIRFLRFLLDDLNSNIWNAVNNTNSVLVSNLLSVKETLELNGQTSTASNVAKVSVNTAQVYARYTNTLTPNWKVLPISTLREDVMLLRLNDEDFFVPGKYVITVEPTPVEGTVTSTYGDIAVFKTDLLTYKTRNYFYGWSVQLKNATGNDIGGPQIVTASEWNTESGQKIKISPLPNSLGFEAGIKAVLTPNTFSPILIEVDIVEQNALTLSYNMYAKKELDTDTGLCTIYDYRGNVYKRLSFGKKETQETDYHIIEYRYPTEELE